jgi:NAD(P)-dependent dehydrogenase (short-subunit alcohol dehydrogenase family)
MMGRRTQDQAQLFYSFDLDAVVPDDHLVRKIAAVLDLSWVHAEMAPHYSAIGRPSIDPVPMIRMLIIGYMFAIRSERALCREVQVNLAYRWFCGLSIEDKLPDHSAFSRARNERFRNSAAYGASKWGIRSLTRTAAYELARDKIRVNSVHPGIIDTPLAYDPKTGEELVPVDRFAIPRMASVSEIARYVLFASSEDASFSTGSEFVADGGFALGPIA